MISLSRPAYYLPVLAYMGLIFTLSAISTLPGGGILPDKPVHAVEYGVLAVLLLRWFQGNLAEIRTGPTIAAIAVAVLYGISDEFHQSFVPGREMSGWDLLADTIGAGAGIALIVFLVRYRSRLKTGSHD